MTFRDSRAKCMISITAIYLFAGAVGILLIRSLPYEYWLNLLIADITGTILIFVFSTILKNASVYDPYWSVFPVAAITFFASGRDLTQLNLLHLAAIWFWGIRLTWNWAYTFQGLNSQDWRYTLLFIFVSIPIAEKRQSVKDGYAEYRKETRMLLPIRPR